MEGWSERQRKEVSGEDGVAEVEDNLIFIRLVTGVARSAAKRLICNSSAHGFLLHVWFVVGLEVIQLRQNHR